MILPSLEMGGMERMVCDLALGLQRVGVSTRVICSASGGVLAGQLAMNGVSVTALPAGGRQSWMGTRSLIALLRDARPDIVHTHSGYWWRGGAAAWRANVPVTVHTVHGLLAAEPWWGPMEKRLGACITDRVVAVSTALSTYLTDTCCIPAKQVITRPNGIDLSRFGGAEPLPLAEQHGFAPGAFVFGCVARLAPVKNLTLGISALLGLVGQGVDAHYVLAGDGPERERLQNVAAAAGLTSRVHLLGEVAEPARLLAALDAFILPSHAEGTSISLLEAMASRLPCVVTAVGGSPDVVAHGGAGILIPADDPGALTEALLLLARDPRRSAELGDLGRSRVESAYSLEVMVKSYLQVYADARGGTE